jgi:hypothetical protein
MRGRSSFASFRLYALTSTGLVPQALAGDRGSVAVWRHQQAAERKSESDSSTPAADVTGPEQAAASVPKRDSRRGLVIAVAGAYQPSGKSLVAAGLACALGLSGPAILVDADMRFGTTPFTLGMSVVAYNREAVTTKAAQVQEQDDRRADERDDQAEDRPRVIEPAHLRGARVSNCRSSHVVMSPCANPLRRRLTGGSGACYGTASPRASTRATLRLRSRFELAPRRCHLSRTPARQPSAGYAEIRRKIGNSAASVGL